MNCRTVLLTLFLFFLITYANAQDSWNLKRAVEYALANNISVKQADIDSRLAALTLKQNRLYQYPTAALSSSAGINAGRSIDPTTNLFTNTQLFSNSFGFSSAVTVFNFFSLKHNIEGSRLDEEAAQINVDKIKNDIALNVATAYLQVVEAQQQVGIAKVAVQQTLQNLDNTRRRVEAGALPELNLAELEAQLATDSSTLITADNSVRQYILQLKALLNIDAGQRFVVEVPPLDKIPVQSLQELQPEAVYALSLQNLPEQKVNDLRIMAAQKYVKSARGQMYPAFSLYFTLGTNYANNKNPTIVRTANGKFDTLDQKAYVNGLYYNILTPSFDQTITSSITPYGTQINDNFRQNFGIQLNIPLFNNGVARTNWEKSKLNVSSLQLRKDQALQTLKQNIYSAYNDASTSIQKFYSEQKSVQTAEKAYDYAKKRYDLGLLTTIDLLTNQNNLNRARVALTQAQVDYVFRLKLLEFYKGQGLVLE